MRLVIIDFHTHIFPPDVRQNRDDYLRRDPTFAEMYANPKAKTAGAEELLASSAEAGVEVSVALGFAWSRHDDCVRHNDYLLAAAGRSGGRVLPFCTVNPLAGEAALKEVERCARSGARGLGELRPESQGWSLDGEAGDALAELASRLGLILLFHVTEPVGHSYPGKQGLRLDSFSRFVDRVGEGVSVVGAHLAGGLPLHASMPAARRSLSSVHMDTAALGLLYRPSVLPDVVRTLGADRLLFGSDFPLLGQSAALDSIRGSGLDDTALRSVLGENARSLLGLEAAPSQ